MRILHYTLGLPPKRSGGLTKYALDLMIEQAKEHHVIHLFPGNIDLIKKRTRIKKSKEKLSGIENHQIVNSLPLPLFNGIKQPDDFMQRGPLDIYKNFLERIRPDIVHIHSLMGIHQEFFEAAKLLGIKIVYTTHDYFGICPKKDLFKEYENKNCENYEDGFGCANCCLSALNTKTILLSQTPIYPLLKRLKGLKRASLYRKVKTDKLATDNGVWLAKKYVILREFYLKMLKSVDFFHFNSNLTEQVFKKYLKDINGKVIGITNSNIKMNKELLKSTSRKIRIGYMGPFKAYKGFFKLIDTFKKLPSMKYELHLYGDDSHFNTINNVYVHGRYKAEQLETIYSQIDVLVVPSLWKETFGFTVLEGLNYLTPIIVSENVGSKDLVECGFGWVYNPNSNEELYNILKNLDYKILEEYQTNIRKNIKDITMNIHTKRIIDEIYGF